jgi:hypothetical protein
VLDSALDKSAARRLYACDKISKGAIVVARKSLLLVTVFSILVVMLGVSAGPAAADDTPPAGCCELGGETQTDDAPPGSASGQRVSYGLAVANTITDVTTGATNDGSASSGVIPNSCQTCHPSSWYNQTVTSHGILWEGEGNIDPTTGRPKYYTCGPASARNVIWDLTNSDYGEAYFESLLHTTRSGTVVRDMDNYLNARFTAYQWTDYLPSSASVVLGEVISDTYQYRYLPMQGLNTASLIYFNHKSLSHIDFDYGYNGGSVYMAEEWNPIKVFGSSSYGNPYGFHLETATNLFLAIHAGVSKAMIL